ncbi:MAG: carbohydrate porin [Prevotellaceae bacterium]|nr:carbohydrate porin [Prevotellaceae bacterium]
MRKNAFILLLCVGCLLPLSASAQSIGGEMTSEWQWSPNKKTVNWMNMLRLDFEYSPWKGGTFQAATIHMAKTNPDESIISDYQVFSNIQEENCYAAIAVLGYQQSWKHANLFVGVRNMNEDYFASPVTSYFTNSSPGIFPTISANYPVANYPVSSMTIHLELIFDNWHVKNSLYNGAAYNGWKRGDNPFIIRPHKDGVLDVLELSYDDGKSFYSVGSTFHNGVYDEDMEPVRKTDAEGNPTHGYEKKASFGWWAYAEQCLWQSEDEEKKVSLMVQYSENTRGKRYFQEEQQEGCKRYAELGCLYDFGDNHAGFTAQYAHYGKGKEESLELTYSRDVKDCLSLQPVFNYIHNAEEKGNYVVFSGRLVYSF